MVIVCSDDLIKNIPRPKKPVLLENLELGGEEEYRAGAFWLVANPNGYLPERTLGQAHAGYMFPMGFTGYILR
jgi:hypothetical protein